MRLKRNILPLFTLMISLSLICHAATITGVVKDPTGAPFEGAFVEAQNAKTNITVIVLSNRQGRYRIEKLPKGEYRLQIRATGYGADPRPAVNLLADGQNASFDFALHTTAVSWSDISIYQATKLWPAGKGKDLILTRCAICHEFQHTIASKTLDENGWKTKVTYMREAMHYSILLGPHFNDQDAADVASYLTTIFGPQSVLPKFPSEMPEYQQTVHNFSDEAMNIVYVEYEMPGPNRLPFSAAPDKHGNLWIPNFGLANKITRLNPTTGEMQDYAFSYKGTASVHSAVPGPDGSVWFAEQGTNRLGKWDAATQKITEYQDEYLPGKEGIEDGGSKHTLRLDTKGRVWSSGGGPLTSFDPETRKFTHFSDVQRTYDVKPDKNGDIWFTALQANKIGKVDGKTMKIMQWSLPAPAVAPRRLEIGPDGMVWVGEFLGGKIARFDPKTEIFQEYPLPGPDPTPYALGVDADGYIWYDSHNMDLLGRFDPKTGKVTEYPFPHSELAMREFFRDSQGRMWYGTAPNNKVGYFYLTDKGRGAEFSSK